MSKKGLKVKIEKSDGQLKKDISHWRVGYVIDNNIIYSAWNIGNECIVKMITDDQYGIDLSKLKMSDANQRENKSLNGLFKRRKIQIKSGENF